MSDVGYDEGPECVCLTCANGDACEYRAEAVPDGVYVVECAMWEEGDDE